MDNYTGKRLDGRYEIQEVIGVGGMAVVYKAYDNIDARTVAVKILKEEYLANEEFRRRFKNESKAIAILSHPNIVKVYNVSYGDRLQYIVMEYVEGITLKEYIEQQGKLGIKETVYFTMQILRAFQHAHDKGIVHRDIKPQNIMLLSNGIIKVTDFGIARFSYSDTKTMTDSAIGSVHYISPEQARGSSTDERADIYSVGVVMYEMLTGQLPFQSDNSVSVALMQLQNEPKHPRELNSNIPIGLEQIIMHAMQKNANDRYQSAAEMLLDIEEFKRNPNIRFQKDYFVDNDPTKYVTSTKSQQTERKPVEPVKVVSPQIDDEDEYDDDDEPKRSKAGPIIIGLLIGLLVIAVAAFGVLYFGTDVFRKSSKNVPNFVGKNYELEIKDNEDYKNLYRFEVQEVSNGAYKDGLVFDQEPKSGQRIDPSNKVIILYVAKNAQKVVVTDVSGMQYAVAAETLEKKGFVVNSLPIMNTYLEFGQVIRTEPEGNTEAESGSTVTIYYASDEDLIEVPKVANTGFFEEMARAIIESASLVFDTNVKYENSSEQAGIVIGQSPEAGEKVIAGSKVSIVVSNGIPEISKATIKIILPSNNTTGSFEVFVDNESVVKKTLLLDGGEYSFTIEGSGEQTPIKVFINNSEYYSCNVDFSKSPGVVSDGVYAYPPNSSAKRKTMPDVVGMTAAQAQSTLNAEGFTNVKIQDKYTSNPSENGVVIAQSPEASQTGILTIPTQYPLDYEIILYVGKGMF